MSTESTADDTDGPLAGLVSAEAEHLYGRLLLTGAPEIGPGPDQVDLDSAPAQELLEAQVVFSSDYLKDKLQPVPQATSLRLLLQRHHNDLMVRQNQAVTGWSLLDKVMSASAGPSYSTAVPEDSLGTILTDRTAIHRLAHELQRSVQREMLSLVTSKFKSPLREVETVVPPEPAIRRGLQARSIYDTEIAGSRAGAAIIEACVRGGEQARIRADVPLKMIYVDDRLALVALTDTGTDGSLLVQSPLLLAALRSWFEFLWNDSGTTPVNTTATAGELSAAQLQILRLLASGLGDDAVARTSGMSVRTVRRHVTAILEQLGVTTRFAAGAMATRRGWI